MDVRMCLSIILMSLVACGQKTTKTVFPENYKKPTGQCANSILPTQFVVMWENGSITVEKSENSDLFEQSFLSKNLPNIRYVEFNKRITISDVINPRTSASSDQTWGQEHSEAPAVWSLGVKGKDVLVAVVDAAVDYSHPQIAPRLNVNIVEKNGKPGVDDDGDGFIDNVYGWDFFGNAPAPYVDKAVVHGTHVSGIILADHNSGLVRGMAPEARLIPINFMDSRGGGDLGAAIRGIRYAVDHGAKIINASWGGGGCEEPLSLKETIQALAQKNILFVSAAGNEGVDIESFPTYPASFNLANQITVAATRSSDIMAMFSNTGFHAVHLAAPGDGILSSVPGGYDYLSGTSMAAPFVSGAAALLWSDRPTASVQQIKQALLSSVDTGNYQVLSGGRLNVRKALDEIRRIVP